MKLIIILALLLLSACKKRPLLKNIGGSEPRESHAHYEFEELPHFHRVEYNAEKQVYKRNNSRIIEAYREERVVRDRLATKPKIFKRRGIRGRL